MSYERVYDPYKSKPRIPKAFADETKTFIRGKYPSGSRGREKLPRCDLIGSYSTLIVDDNWELHRRDSPYPDDGPNDSDGPERLAFARHIRLKFEVGGPEVWDWDNIARELQDSIFSKYKMLDVALEFTQSDSNRTISTWYPPKIEKEKLRAFFERNGPDGLYSENSKWEADEDEDDLIIVPMLRLTIIGGEDDTRENQEGAS
ncbi:hypothetical protein GQX73_g5199 [Xylaria multiplex]|uniref:Uncharacterized protein n=1 Tax=Xylaria multiplex TaxID=323545 RepID=A0A7C8MUH4_9PEZI|nr:hypothetical protein GQX73_g5199 [Xylaria multiplex]